MCSHSLQGCLWLCHGGRTHVHSGQLCPHAYCASNQVCLLALHAHWIGTQLVCHCSDCSVTCLACYIVHPVCLFCLSIHSSVCLSAIPSFHASACLSVCTLCHALHATLPPQATLIRRASESLHNQEGPNPPVHCTI